MRIRTLEAPAHIGQRVHLGGWMHSWRDMGQFGFLVLRDGAGTFQAVLDNADEMAKLRGLLKKAQASSREMGSSWLRSRTCCDMCGYPMTSSLG